MFVVLVYLLVSGGVAVLVGLHAGFFTALCALAASYLAVFASGAIRYGFRTADIVEKIGVVTVAVGLTVLAYWLGGEFTLRLAGHHLGGHIWTVAGLAVGFLFAVSRPAALTDAETSGL